MTHATSWTTYGSPLGPLTLTASEHGLSGLQFPVRARDLTEAGRRPEAFTVAVEQLEEYFAGTRTAFTVPLDLRAGTAFQRAVWAQLLTIPCGVTVSYTELAGRVGRPDRVRAVAAAVGRTPVPVIVPCHRVVGAGGELTGYLGGLHRKRALLDLEAAVAGDRPAPEGYGHRQLSLL